MTMAELYFIRRMFGCCANHAEWLLRFRFGSMRQLRLHEYPSVRVWSA